ncbi:9360_t:CDS:2, partial [Acaulospora colombiana]
MTHIEELQKILKPGVKFRNWSKTFGCAPELYFEPECEEDVIKIVELAKTNNKNVRAIGSGHSPSDLACTEGYMINMDKLNRILKIDREAKTVVVEAGMKLHKLNAELNKHGMALSSLGSISDQSISGAISTGTHGSGINFRNLCGQIVSLTLVTSSKGVMRCSANENPDVYKAALCSLGALGELKPRDSSYIRDTLLGFHAYQLFLYLSRFVPSMNPLITRAMFNLSFSKPAHVIDTSYKVFNFDCMFPQYVNEWSIPLDKTEVAMRKLYKWVDGSGLSMHFPVEVRFVDQDDVWLSPAYGRRRILLFFRPYHQPVPYKKYWAAFEEIMKSCDGRPHWAKGHSMSVSELSKSYPKFDSFIDIQKQLDPSGIFLNPYLNRHLFGLKGENYDTSRFKAKLRNRSFIPLIQFALSEIRIDRFIDKANRNPPQKTPIAHSYHNNDSYYGNEYPDQHEFDNSYNDECRTPIFRYECLDEKIVLLLIQDCQINIPLNILRGIEKVQERSISLILRESAKPQEHIIIKLHSNDDTRIFLFPKSVSSYTTIKQTIEEALYISYIDKFKYRDDSGEFITISTPREFDIALKLYAKNNKMELWYMNTAGSYGN